MAGFVVIDGQRYAWSPWLPSDPVLYRDQPGGYFAWGASRERTMGGEQRHAGHDYNDDVFMSAARQAFDGYFDGVKQPLGGVLSGNTPSVHESAEAVFAYAHPIPIPRDPITIHRYEYRETVTALDFMLYEERRPPVPPAFTERATSADPKLRTAISYEYRAPVRGSVIRSSVRMTLLQTYGFGGIRALMRWISPMRRSTVLERDRYKSAVRWLNGLTAAEFFDVGQIVADPAWHGYAGTSFDFLPGGVTPDDPVIIRRGLTVPADAWDTENHAVFSMMPERPTFGDALRPTSGGTAATVNSADYHFLGDFDIQFPDWRYLYPVAMPPLRQRQRPDGLVYDDKRQFERGRATSTQGSIRQGWRGNTYL